MSAAVIVAAGVTSFLASGPGVGGEVVALAGRAHGPLSTSSKTFSDTCD